MVTLFAPVVRFLHPQTNHESDHIQYIEDVISAKKSHQSVESSVSHHPFRGPPLPHVLTLVSYLHLYLCHDLRHHLA